MFPGFGGVGLPRNLIAALHRQGAKDLTGVSNNAGALDDKVDVGTLVEAGQMKKMICAFTAATHPSRITPFVQMYNNDEIDAELVPQGTLAERMRAAPISSATLAKRWRKTESGRVMRPPPGPDIPNRRGSRSILSG